MNRLTAISGWNVKGPACFLLETGGRRVLLDLGEGPDGRRRPDLSGVGRLDAILVSHAHGDHVGALDLAGQVGDPPVFCTPLARTAGPAGLAPACDLGEAGRVLRLPVAAGPAGHAPGAVWMRIGGPDAMLYTGDMSGPGGLYAHAAPPRARALLLDASYGMAQVDPDAQRTRLLAVAEAGPLLLPAPPDGRGLEMALACFEAGHEVGLCPHHVAVARHLMAAPSWIAPQMAPRLAALLAAARTLTADAPLRGVMVAGGANCGAGLAAVLGPRALAEGGATVLFTGHLSDGTPAAAWVAQGAARWAPWAVHPTAAVLDALLGAVRPAVVMPAFAGAADRAAVASHFPQVAFADGPVMTW